MVGVLLDLLVDISVVVLVDLVVGVVVRLCLLLLRSCRSRSTHHVLPFCYTKWFCLRQPAIPVPGSTHA